MLLINNYVLLIPSLTLMAEVARCSGDPAVAGTSNYVCLDSEHISVILFSGFGGAFCILLAFYCNFFINTQFPSKSLPHSTWNPKPKMIFTIWKVLYIYHYDLLDERYRLFFRCFGLGFLLYQRGLMAEMPRAYSKVVSVFDLTFMALLLVLNSVIIF